MDKIKIFISYCHKNETYVEDFEKYISPMKDKYNLDLWRDTENKAGEKFQKKIDEQLNQSDIILLFISSDFLSSDACKKELKQSLELKEKQNIILIPIILFTCEWQETELKNLLVVPKDAKPVSDFEDKNKAWQDITNSIKPHIEKLDIINKIEIKKEFSEFLKDSEALEKLHHNKTKISLDDIFVSPKLKCYDETRDFQEEIDYQNLERDIIQYKNIVIAGKDQSGKTTLCKRLFLALKQKGYLPVYIFDKEKKLQGKIENRIEKSFNKQYKTKYNETLSDRIIPIIDNFHDAQNRQEHIKSLEKYVFSILIVDDIYGLNIKDKNIIKRYKHFEIKEFSPSLRNQLIKKWNQLSDHQNDDNETYKDLDKKTELVNATLGKIIGNGIVPSYPFFILSILSTYETVNPLDENITSQGHCYQALIYIALRKEIRNEDVDIYLNFLTVIAYQFFITKKKEFNADEIAAFIKDYKEKYNLPIKTEELFTKLNNTKILIKNGFGGTLFQYDYLYFYFVAKYISEHIEENKKIMEIMENLHTNENAYIAIFISHHSKNNYVLDEVVLNAMCLFEKHDSATLKKEELKFLDFEMQKHIVEAALLSHDETSEHNRTKQLEQQDKIEEAKSKKEASESEENENELVIELRRSIKTVEIMGRIIKNRAGSLEKERLKEIFEEGMKVHFRLLKSFIEAIRKKESQDDMIDFIKDRLEKISKDSKKEIPKEKLQKIATIIFWNLNFGIFFVFINKIVHSLGADNLKDITNKICDNVNTPASFLVKHGILMWYSKNLRIDDLCNKIKEKEFSYTAQKIIKYMVINHVSMHKINLRDRQKLENKLKLNLPKNKLLKEGK